ncbi:MAG TPA: MFS transporter [Candidatus Hydrogenedentes bacterium]|nr:MFS transporter [Candidatus Hydrogenedentota bacterium]
MMRAVILLASVCIQMCIGGLYAWSSYIHPLRVSYGLSTAQTQLIFGGLIAVFTVSMIYAGLLLEQRGPKLVAGIGGVLFGSGYVMASLSGGSFLWMCLGISVVAGIGTGFCYVCALAMCMGWFPERKGVATGVGVAGFGGGAVLLSRLVDLLFEQNMDVLVVLRWVGVAYGAIILGAAFLLKSAPFGGRPPSDSPLIRRDLMQDRFFWALVVGMFCGTSAGLLVIGNLSPIALAIGLPPAVATTAVGAFAIGNAGGRIVWGWIADKSGPGVITLSLAVLAATIVGLLPMPTRSGNFPALAMAVGFGFGGCFVVYATQTASRYGVDRVASIYPLVFLAYGVGGIVGPWVGGCLYDMTESYTPAVVAGVGIVLLGLLASAWLIRTSGRHDSAAVAPSGHKPCQDIG